MEIPICYRDNDLVVVWKPSGLLVHPTQEAPDSITLLQLIRKQVGKRVYPVHRLDRQTCGLVVFALTSESAGKFSLQIQDHRVKKGYLALVRGFFPPGPLFLDNPVRAKREDRSNPAQSRFQLLEACQKPWPIGRYDSARYSLVVCEPISGRRHQLRRHLAHLRHPIIGDRMYGDRFHNAFFGTHTPWNRLHLTSVFLQFESINLGETIRIFYCMDAQFREVMEDLFEIEINAAFEKRVEAFIAGLDRE